MRRFFYLLSGLGVLFCSLEVFATKDRGRELYKLCEKCHGLDGGGKNDILVPSIAGRAEWALEYMLHKYKDGKLIHPNDEPAVRMTSIARMLKSEDISLVAKYVAAMKPVPLKPTIVGNTDEGEAKFAVCSACHGADAEGKKELNAPPLVGLPDWYIFNATPKYLSGGHYRRSDPSRNMEGAAMAAGADAVKDENDRRNVIDYILALQGVKGTGEDKKPEDKKAGEPDKAEAPKSKL